MQIKTKTIPEKGHYLVRILVLLSLTNLFLYALLTFATSIKLATATLMRKKNHLAVSTLMTNEVASSPSSPQLKCNSTKLIENLQLNICEEEISHKTIQFLNEKYEEE